MLLYFYEPSGPNLAIFMLLREIMIAIVEIGILCFMR